jgi:hypothetical protein
MIDRWSKGYKDQELLLRGQQGLVPLESNVLLLEMGQAQFPMAQSPQKTLASLVLSLVMAGVDPD